MSGPVAEVDDGKHQRLLDAEEERMLRAQRASQQHDSNDREGNADYLEEGEAHEQRQTQQDEEEQNQQHSGQSFESSGNVLSEQRLQFRGSVKGSGGGGGGGGGTDPLLDSPRRLMPRASVLQDEQCEKLRISRDESTRNKAFVSKLAGKKYRRVGSQMTAVESRQGCGQWVTMANQVPDSLDFEDVENSLLQDERSIHKGHVEPARWKMWVIIVVIAIMTAVVAFGINEGIKSLQDVKFAAVTKYMKTAGSRFNTTERELAIKTGQDVNLVIPFFAPYMIYVLFNLLYVLLAATLVIWGEPLAKGSGIAEIKCYLNGIRVFRVVRLKTLCCKAVGILFSVASGLPCGKEGPMIHSGAAIASGISTGKSSKLHLDTGLFTEFRSDRDKRNFVTAGAAAGVGAAFGAPIGGLLFAVEEVGSFWKIELTIMVFICAAITPFALAFMSDPTDNTTGAIKGLIDFGKVEGTYSIFDIPFLILLGVCGGLLGALFNFLNLRLARLRKKYVVTKLRQLFEALFVSLCVSSVLMILVLRGYQCVDAAHPPPRLEAQMKDYGCPKGQYNDMATYFFHSMEASIGLLIHTERNIDYSSLIKQFIPYYFLTILTFGTMVPSGLFLPTLALGVNFGHLFAQVWNSVLPGEHALSVTAYALFGGMAILSGVVRMTISIIVIIMEATANIGFFYPLCIIAVTAKFVGDFFNHGIYDEYIHFNKIPLLETHLERPEMYLMRAEDILNPAIITIPTKVTVAHLVGVLKTNPYHNLLVTVDDDGVFTGILLRRSALILVVKRAWEKDLDIHDFLKSAKERELLKLKKYHTFDSVKKGDMQKTIDLIRYVDQWPYTFQLSTPVPRVHRTFRELGLRHIIILDNQRRPAGVITRKQLCFLELADPAALEPDYAHDSGGLLSSQRNVFSLKELPQSDRAGVDVDDDEDDTDGGADGERRKTAAEEGWEDGYKPHVN